MAIKLFGGRLVLGKDLAQYAGRADEAFAVMQQRYGADYKSRNRLDAYRNVVYDCVSLIGEAMGDYTPYVERKNGDQWERVDHELIDLVRHPSGNIDEAAESFSNFDLWEATSSYQLLQGDCFWYMVLGKSNALGRATTRPREIIMLRPDKVGTDIDKKTGKINGYFVRQSFGDPIPLEINEVLRFNLFNPANPYKGYGPVESNSDYIETDESTALFTKRFFQNNAGISGVLNVKGEVTKGAFRKFVRAWREKHEGADNAGKVAILRDSDAMFTKVSLGLNELNMAELRKMTVQDVLRAFKVPLPLLGEAEQTGLGRANVEALEYIFAKYNIDKKMKRFDAVLQFALERYYPEDAKKMRINHESVIPENREFMLQERIAGVDKWMKRNEIRDEQGLDAVDGGDQLFVPAMSLPLDEPISGEEPEDDPTTPDEPAKAIQLKLIRTVTTTKGTSQNERFRLTLMRNQVRYERQYRKTVKPIFTAQRTEALYNLEAHSSNLAKASGQKLFDDAAYDAQLVEKLTPMLTDLTKTQGGLALIFAGDEENEFHLTSDILAKLTKGTSKMASGFNDETLDKLNKTLAEGIQAGEGIGELKKRVNGVYDNISGYRSERIARTETLKASNSATLEAYRQTGYVTQKAWAVNPNACDECNDYNGKTVPLDDPFLSLGETHTFTDSNGDEQEVVNSYDTIEEPPLHPNCRCTIIPIR